MSELKTKYNAYKSPRLKLLFNNARTPEDKKAVIKEILVERGDFEDAPAEAVAPAANPTPAAETEAPAAQESPAPEPTPAVEAKPEASPEPAKPAAAPAANAAEAKPKEKKERVKKTNENDPWTHKEGDTVKVQLAKNRKDGRGGEIVEGVVKGTFEWQNFKVYKIKVEGLAMLNIRQNSLAKVN